MKLSLLEMAGQLDEVYAVLENGYWKERVGDVAEALHDAALAQQAQPEYTDGCGACNFIRDTRSQLEMAEKHGVHRDACPHHKSAQRGRDE